MSPLGDSQILHKPAQFPRKRAILSCLLIFCYLISACSAAQSSKLNSTELSIYSFAEYVPAALVASFEQATGVKVTLTTYANNEAMLAELAKNPTEYDIVIPSDYAIEILIKQDGLQALDLALIPNYSNIQQSFLSPYFDPGGLATSRRPSARNQKFSLPYLWGTTGIVYDPSKLTAPITKWADLWRPELAGHLVVLDDAREMLGMALLSLGYDKNSTDPTQIGAAGEKLKQLAAGIIAYDSATPEKSVLSGVAWAGVVFNGNAALATRSNPNLTYVFPEEGAGIWFDNLAIPIGATHTDAAYAFINYALDKEQGALLIKEFPYSSPNQAAIDYLQSSQPDFYQAYTSSPINNPSPDLLAGAKLNKNLGQETSALFDQTWAGVKGK